MQGLQQPLSDTKIQRTNKTTKKSCCSCESANLDTLAQHRNDTKKTYQKRAKRKAYTHSILFQLIDTKSELNKSYWQTYHCSNVLKQEGKKVTSRYCNQRWCFVCNSIRTANFINGYKSVLENFEEPMFVTLTAPTVKADDLKTELEKRYKAFTNIKDNLRKQGIKIKGLRKTECHYQPKTDTFHPHFHLIIEGEMEAYKVIDLWLKQVPNAKPQAQDVRVADSNAIIELCKYFSKLTNGKNFYAKEMDIVFQAMKGKRVIQPFGIKKDVSEDVEEMKHKR